jgi:hypothetical protein
MAIASAQEVDEVIPRGSRKFEVLSIPAMPAYEPATARNGDVLTLSRTEIVAELRELTGVKLNERGADLLPADEPRISCRYEQYSAVKAAWFKRYVRWFEKELRALGLTYQREMWDCDDFSMALNAFADLALLRNKSHPPPHLIGRLVVYQDRRWSGVAAGGLHELVIVRTERGWQVVEPQTGEIESLEEYPNRDAVKEVLFN